MAGSSCVVAGNDDVPPINSYVELRVDSTPGACYIQEAVTLAPLTRYRLSLECFWKHEDPAQLVPAHVAKASLV